jgi:hypothetical protein
MIYMFCTDWFPAGSPVCPQCAGLPWAIRQHVS